MISKEGETFSVCTLVKMGLCDLFSNDLCMLAELV